MDEVDGKVPAVQVVRRGHVLIVAIARPQAMNSVNAEVSTGVGTALEEAEHDADIRAVVLTGTGDTAFCAGADLKALSRGESLLAPGHEDWGFAGYVRHPISKPTIAAVNGFALGGGTEIALASDLVVAAESASFGLPEVRRGLFAAAGGAFRLPEQVPAKVAMEMILTGEPITAGRALELGLVNRVVPAAEVLESAVALAELICRNAPLAVQASKRLARGITGGGIPAEDAAWAHNAEERTIVMTSEDCREGTRAFAEKRAPIWAAR